uniref:Multifunctional fusion protein n=1 Tax=Phytophthora ramorum TaxID=164328 RepID=H3H6E5_PHYRM
MGKYKGLLAIVIFLAVTSEVLSSATSSYQIKTTNLASGGEGPSKRVLRSVDAAEADDKDASAAAEERGFQSAVLVCMEVAFTDAYIAMKDGSVVYVKRGAVQKLLWAMVAAMAALSLFLLTYAHLIYLPAMSGEQGSRQFLRAGRHQPTPIASSLRAVYKKQSENFNEDQEKVVNMTRHAWHGYRKFAGWSDYLGMPSLEGGNVYGHDMALTTVDSLDTLFVMGLHDEFDEASAWVKANLSETMFRESTVSFFEVTIRSLGGLLSAYYLSGEQHFLTLAHSLGKALQTAFTCGNYVPCRSVDHAF